MKNLTRILGYLFVIVAFFRIVPIITGLVYNEPVSLFLFSALLSMGIGFFLIQKSKLKTDEKEQKMSLSQGLILVALSFILLPLIGALSFLPSLNGNFINAYFESVSGFTTTGLTVYENLNVLPKSLLMWRALTQWMGGIGIVMVFLFIFSKLKSHDNTSVEDINVSAQTTLTIYQSQGFDAKLKGSLNSSVAHVMIIYLGYTLLGMVLLFLAGLPLYEAIGMTFTAFSTGGFSMNDHFNYNFLQLFILSFLMLLGAISFITHNQLLQKQWRAFLKSFEKNVLLFFILASAVATFAVTTNIGTMLFELISAFTTTGYSRSSIMLLPHLVIFMIMLGMVLGGNIASTSGGIKTFRIYYLIRSIPWSVKKLASPRNSIIPLKIHDHEVSETDLVHIGIFVFTYVFIAIIGTVLFMVFGYSFLNASFQVISALGTVGLQTMSLAELNPLLKGLLMLLMILGRLEIFPLLILLKTVLKKENKSLNKVAVNQ